MFHEKEDSVKWSVFHSNFAFSDKPEVDFWKRVRGVASLELFDSMINTTHERESDQSMLKTRAEKMSRPTPTRKSLNLKERVHISIKKV